MYIPIHGGFFKMEMISFGIHENPESAPGNYSSQKRAYAPSSGNYPAVGALSGRL